MARSIRQQPKKKQEAPKYRCRDCAHSYDWQNRSFNDGQPILCRCQHDARSQHGKFCKFLSDYQCDQFVKRPTNAENNAEAN